MNKNVTDILTFIAREETAAEVNQQANYHGMRLNSAFQPIFSLSHCRVVGYEGLIRAFDAQQNALPVWKIFGHAKTEAEIVELDRLSRALHLHNFMRQQDDLNWLFLNINPQVIVEGRHYGSFFQGLLEHYGIPASQVVVEIIEGAIGDEGQLSDSVRFYKDLGCLVAIDDFGSGHSNFERIWRLSPDIVKLDRSMITQAVSTAVARRVLPGVVSLIHEAGSLVLIEGIETEEEALIAMETDVDLVQGYYFGRPAFELLKTQQSDCISQLFSAYGREVGNETRHIKIDKTLAVFTAAAERIANGQSMAEAVAELLPVTGVDRCYLLDELGIQIGTSALASTRRARTDARYGPLANGSGANWIRRPYLRRALKEPSVTQITRPYLSIANGSLCVTLSIAIPVSGQTQVLCCDVDWE